MNSQRSLYWFAIAFACFYVNAAIALDRLGVI